MLMEPARIILVVEEDPATRAFLADNLTADGYEVLVADDKPGALAKLAARRPDIVVCDVNGDTLELLDAVRQADGVAGRIEPDTPLIVLSTDADELARLRYLDRGGDDVISKPFSYAELRARIRVLLHRTHGRPAAGRLRVGPLTIDPTSREVRVDGARVELSQKEFALLRRLAAEPTRVFTKAELLRDVWGFRALGATRTLDSHACRLRQKLSVRGDRFVVNVWGVGYRLVDCAVGERAATATAVETGEAS
jgi:DNA-binding response OmpR family regulator